MNRGVNLAIYNKNIQKIWKFILTKISMFAILIKLHYELSSYIKIMQMISALES